MVDGVAPGSAQSAVLGLLGVVCALLMSARRQPACEMRGVPVAKLSFCFLLKDVESSCLAWLVLRAELQQLISVSNCIVCCASPLIVLRLRVK